MTTFLQFLIISLAAFRIVRLVIEDTIIDPLREKTIWKLNPEGKLREMLECPWCFGFWVSVLAVISFWLWPATTVWVALPFAISAVIGLIAEHSE